LKQLSCGSAPGRERFALSPGAVLATLAPVSFGARVQRVVVGEGGPGAFVGTLLLLGVGLALTWTGVSDIRLAVEAPKRLSCAEFIADPSKARWVILEGCRLDLNAATTRRWKGWFAGKDGGTPARHLELFVPISALGTTPPEVPKVVLATMDPVLLSLVETIDRTPPEQVEAFIDAKAKEIEAVLAPKELKASVAPLAPTGSRPALAQMMAPEAVVLEQGREPKRAESLCSLLLGLGVMLFAFWPMARRFQLERELGAIEPPSG
jgi:hypothetical protein